MDCHRHNLQPFECRSVVHTGVEQIEQHYPNVTVPIAGPGVTVPLSNPVEQALRELTANAVPTAGNHK